MTDKRRLTRSLVSALPRGQHWWWVTPHRLAVIMPSHAAAAAPSNTAAGPEAHAHSSRAQRVCLTNDKWVPTTSRLSASCKGYRMEVVWRELKTHAYRLSPNKGPRTRNEKETKDKCHQRDQQLNYLVFPPESVWHSVKGR